jgi:hypothetical protein
MLQTKQNGRVVIPLEIIKHIASLYKEALESCNYKLVVSVVDQLCPKFNDRKRKSIGHSSPKRIFLGGSMARAISAIALIAAPFDKSYLKMAPHKGDGFKGNLSKLNNTWNSVISTLLPSGGWPKGWVSCKPIPIERNKHYKTIAKESDITVRTEETTGWANVTFCLDLKKLSPTAKKLVDDYRKNESLMDFLVEGGHGNPVLVIPQKHLKKFEKHLSKDLFEKIKTKSSFSEVIGTISRHWIPDTYPKGDDSILQKAAAYIPLSRSSSNPLRNVGGQKGWKLVKNCQEMQISQVAEYINNEGRAVLIVVVPDGHTAVLMTNGISGADHGIDTCA